ncbi:MAG TPA: 6-bladed beta-propeller [Actinobacteria bacterium]|nr:6-bladed beta-propeller [Actinomycetota bacterium]
MRRKTFLSIALVVLLILLAGLIYLYWVLSRPPEAKGPVKVGGLTHLFSIYGYGPNPEDQLSKPHGIAVDRDKNIYVTDTEHGRVLVFDKDGNYISRFGKQGDKKGEMKAPLGIAVGDDGRVYVCDRILSKILVFSERGKLIKEVKEMMPLTPCVANGKLYVTTYGHVAIFDLDGKLIQRWGQRGKKEGDFEFPNGIAVDKKGNVYISDGNNMRLQAFDKDGEVLWVVGSPPKSMRDRNRRFQLPMGLAIDKDNYLYLVDSFDDSIIIFNSKGKEITKVGERGRLDGQLNWPTGIAYMGNDVFAIADKFNSRAQVVRIGSEKE